MERTITRIAPTAVELPRLRKVCGYVRVSSPKDAMLHSLSAQVSYYNDLIQKTRGWAFAGIFTDEAKTGTKENRQGFQQLLEACRAGKVDMVITKSISRLARNTVTVLQMVRELKALGIDIYFEREKIHTLSAEGELLLTLLASFAQEESRSASQNVKWRVK
ncbi:recombinase family protein, partial [Eubacteriales bacterium OttesenSCG-928-A19]|nr:recombinase family protein [Eubacteriales bacterium OttesenSCG-928-A19]